MSAAHPDNALRILYVEDNALIREMTSDLLTSASRLVIAVGTGEEALRRFNECPFDVVITDLSLPSMSGLDLARAIVATRPSTIIIVVSGYAFNESIEKLGPNVRALSKPVEPEQIILLIGELLKPCAH